MVSCLIPHSHVFSPCLSHLSFPLRLIHSRSGARAVSIPSFLRPALISPPVGRPPRFVDHNSIARHTIVTHVRTTPTHAPATIDVDPPSHPTARGIIVRRAHLTHTYTLTHTRAHSHSTHSTRDEFSSSSMSHSHSAVRASSAPTMHKHTFCTYST